MVKILRSSARIILYNVINLHDVYMASYKLNSKGIYSNIQFYVLIAES